MKGASGLPRIASTPPATPDAASVTSAEIVRPATGTSETTGGVPSRSMTRSDRVTLPAVSWTMVVRVWWPSATPVRSNGSAAGEGHGAGTW